MIKIRTGDYVSAKFIGYARVIHHYINEVTGKHIYAVRTINPNKPSIIEQLPRSDIIKITKKEAENWVLSILHGKTRPPKPTQADFRKIISANRGSDKDINGATTFIVGEIGPEHVEIKPIKKSSPRKARRHSGIGNFNIKFPNIKIRI